MLKKSKIQFGFFFFKSLATVCLLLSCLILGLAGDPCSGTSRLKWNPNSEPDLAGYRIYRGSTSGAYEESRDVGLTTEYVWDGLPTDEDSFFAVTAYRMEGTWQVESDFSNEVFEDVASGNSPPLASDDAFTVMEDAVDQTLAVLESNGGTADSDPDPCHDPWISQVQSKGSAGGNISISGDRQTLVYNPAKDYFGVETFTYEISDGYSTDTALVTVTISPVNVQAVVNRQLFYNNSTFDGYTPALQPEDDAALADGLLPLFPTQTASYSNLDNSVNGINGLSIDISNPRGTLEMSDFEFRIGKDNTPSNWPLAPAPHSIWVRPNAGYQGSHRVMFSWVDGDIKNTWLCVIVKPTPTTGLASKDVFFFGNAIGKTPGDSNLIVGAQDELRIRNNPRDFFNPAPLGFPYDLNRDGRVNAIDQLIARNNVTSFFTALKQIVPTSF